MTRSNFVGLPVARLVFYVFYVSVIYAVLKFHKTKTWVIFCLGGVCLYLQWRLERLISSLGTL